MDTSATLSHRLTQSLSWAGFAVLVLAACLLGIAARPVYVLSAFWPANALLFGLLIRYPQQARPLAWVAAAVGYLVADLVTGSQWQMSLWLTVANLSSVTAGWLVLRRQDVEILRLQRTVAAVYLLAAAVVAAGVGSLVGAAAGPVYFRMGWVDFLLRWFSTELMNYMLVLPVVLTFPRRGEPRTPAQPIALAWRLAPMASLLLAEVMRRVAGGPGMLAFIVPGLLWCALSYSPFVASLLSLAGCLWTLAGMATGVSVFSEIGLGEVFSLRVGVTLLSLGPLAVICANAARVSALQRLEFAVRHDDLTGVLSRRALLERGERLMQGNEGGQSPVAVLLVDIDHFKRINDEHGRRTGDAVLTMVARTLAGALREPDVLGRVGDAEFAVIVPGVTPTGAQSIAERLRRAIESAVCTSSRGEPLPITASLGLAHSVDLGSDQDLDLLMLRADAARYRAKSEGSNRVALA